MNIDDLLKMDMGSAIEWLTENKDDFVLLKKDDLEATQVEEAKQSLFRVGKEVNEDTRIAKNAKSNAVAHILNELSDLQNDNSF